MFVHLAGWVALLAPFGRIEDAELLVLRQEVATLYSAGREARSSACTEPAMA
jgi:hypothetical protein